MSKAEDLRNWDKTDEYGIPLEYEKPEFNTHFVSFYLQNGTQDGCSLIVPDGVDEYDYITETLRLQYGDMFGGIADYYRYDDEETE